VLAGTSSLAGIALSPSSDPAVLKANLPHAGYGQGQVLTTPLRLARVAAAIGSDGAIREVPIVLETGAPVVTTFLTPESAQLLARALRDAVAGGTGRLLARHPARIAGKTGTAEVDDAASHAWFMGFAPHGAATKRIAFAVILENAGYGGASAAAAAGQMVTAAASLGLVR
jgi:peptidoglycan glycosyltransferase